MNITIVCFSGTGTTALIAHELKEHLQGRSSGAVRVLTAEEARKSPESAVEDCDALVLGYPVYDYEPPRIVREMIEALPSPAQAVPTVQFATYGISPGSCLARGADELVARGYHPVLSDSFKAPAPVAAFYARSDMFPFNRLFRFGKGVPEKVEAFADSIHKTFSAYRPSESVDPGPIHSRSRSLAAAVAPGPFFSRATFGIAFYRNLQVSEDCTGCGICAEACPDRNLSIVDGKAVVEKRNGCLRCLRCVGRCPAAAVNFTVRRRIGSIPKEGWKTMYEESRQTD